MSQSTERQRTADEADGRTDDVSIQRSWFDSIVIDGVEQNLIRIPDRVRERQGGLRGGPLMCRHAAAPRM